MNKYPYSRAYFPPAPGIEIRLAVPGEPFSVGPVWAFVDAGADATLVPSRYIDPLGLTPDDRKFLRSQWGERRRVDIYFLDLGIGDYRFPVIEIVSDDRGDELIIGRNVLNHLDLRLNGPKQTIQVSA